MKLLHMAAVAALSIVSGGAAFADGPNDRMAQKHHSRPTMCPMHVSVVLHPTTPAAGWMTNNSPVALSLDAKNPPRVESGELICYYAMPDGYNAFVYFQSLGGRMCTVRADKMGFDCH